MIHFLVLIFIMKCNDKIIILFFSKSGSKPEENGLTQISVQFFFLSKEKHKIHLELRLIQSFSLQQRQRKVTLDLLLPTFI